MSDVAVGQSAQLDTRLEDAEAAYAAVIAKFDNVHQTEVRDALRQARLVLSNIRLDRKDFPARWR